MKTEAVRWAAEEFGDAWLGDRRRTDRLVRMAARVAARPAGRVSEVFERAAEREGAYDFLENKHVGAEELVAHVSAKTAARCSQHPFVFVPIDGSSLALVDTRGGKKFGSVGTLNRGGRGLKVITSLAVSPTGVTVGVLDQRWWARTQAVSCSRKEKRGRNAKRKTGEKETQHWLKAVDVVCERATAAGARAWLQLDREADNQDILLRLASTGHYFTARGTFDRVIEQGPGMDTTLRAALAAQAPAGRYVLNVSAGPGRTAREARMVVRCAKVSLRLKNSWTKTVRRVEVSVVEASEEGTTPTGEAPIDWLLLTNAPISTYQDCRRVVLGYAQRWRIEDFHKAWKSGACNVEDTQLRSVRAVCVWATILATVAARAERLKHLSRAQPEVPASVELDAYEIRALVLLKRDTKKRSEEIPSTMPTLAQAVRWIADLGGYTGKSSGGPPGSITIRRGLERLRPAAEMLRILEAPGGSDQW
jgi:hypothetical protein